MSVHNHQDFHRTEDEPGNFIFRRGDQYYYAYWTGGSEGIINNYAPMEIDTELSIGFVFSDKTARQTDFRYSAESKAYFASQFMDEKKWTKTKYLCWSHSISDTDVPTIVWDVSGSDSKYLEEGSEEIRDLQKQIKRAMSQREQERLRVLSKYCATNAKGYRLLDELNQKSMPTVSDPEDILSWGAKIIPDCILLGKRLSEVKAVLVEKTAHDEMVKSIESTLNQELINNNIAVQETEFWEATNRSKSTTASAAPGSESVAEDLKNVCWKNGDGSVPRDLLPVFYSSCLVLKGEAYVAAVGGRNQVWHFLLTNLRLIVFHGLEIERVIPTENILSYGVDSTAVKCEYVKSSKLEQVSLECAGTGQWYYIRQDVVASVLLAEEWERLNDIQRYLLTTDRATIKKLPGVFVEEFTVMKEPKGCFIATEVYGSSDCPEVQSLKWYRDHRISRLPFGNLLIELYYTTSPHLVRHIHQRKRVKQVIRVALDILVRRIMVTRKHLPSKKQTR